jgi:hypothetical protein
VAALLCLALSACGGGQPPREIADLRLRLADQPRDPALHVELARALARAGQPGGALRHLEEAHRRSALSGADARWLAALYVERARARIALDEAEAWRDAEAAARLDPSAVRAELARDAYFIGARAALRRFDRPGRRAADDLFARAERLAPRDPRLAARAPATADLAEVGAAGAWLADGGARRAALQVYTAYVGRGGRAPAHLRRYLQLHRWWYGERERPSSILLEELRAEHIDLCGVARSYADLGCGETLVRTAENDPAAAERIRQLAATRGWRTADPHLAAALASAALRAWLDGRVASWEAELAARVDLAALVASEVGLASLRQARATLLRAAGRAGEARAALDRAIEEAARLSPEARALLVAEAAAQRRGDGAIDALLHAGPASPAAWHAALRAARAAEPGGAREAALCDAAPLAVARAHLRRSGELGALAARFPSADAQRALARWRRALTDAAHVGAAGDPAGARRRLGEARDLLEARWRRLAAGAPVPASPAPGFPLGAVDPDRRRGEEAPRVAGGLRRVARAYLRDPALADRLAGELADGAIALGERGPLLIELFARLGDPARAWSWAERLSASSPGHAPYLLLAGIAAAAAGDAPRADIFFVGGAAASGDAGAASLLAARAFLAAARPLPALTAARRAFDLTAPGEPDHVAAIEVVARAMDRLNRDREAEGMRALLPDGAGAAAAAALGDAPAIDLAIGPLPAATAPTWPVQVASLLAVGLIAPPERAGPALAAVADAFERAGLVDLAEAVRRERGALPGLAPPGLSPTE